MSIELRPADPSEIGQLGLLGAYVYGGAFGDGEDNYQAQSTRAEWTLCAFDGPRMVASYATIPFTMRAQGQPMSMGGVSSVGTLPEYRRRGLVRAITTRAFEEMREANQPIASLWASQAAIYQRYGYAQASVLRRYTIDTVDIRMLEEAPASIEVSRAGQAEVFDEIRDVYRRFVADRMGSLHRSKVLWQGNTFNDIPSEGPVHVAVARNGSGNAIGYMVYTLRGGRRDHGSRDQEIIIRDTAWLDIGAYRALWEYMARHDLVGRVGAATYQRMTQRRN